MNPTRTRSELAQLLRRYRIIRLIEVVMSGAAAGIVTIATAGFFVTATYALAAGILALLTVATVRIIQLQLFRIDEQAMAGFLNRQFPQFQESGDLLLADPSGLSSLERMQQSRTVGIFRELRPSLRLPHQLLKAFVALVGCSLMAAVIMTGFRPGPADGDPISAPATSTPPTLPAAVESVHLVISPPPYTQLPTVRQNGFPVSAPAESMASWTIRFTGSVRGASLIFNGRDTLVLALTENTFTASRRLRVDGFYQLRWETANGAVKYSDYFPVQLKKDQAPQLKIEQPSQFVQLTPSQRQVIELKAALTDDYGLSDAYLVATVSKGSGEAIKFREETLRFDRPLNMKGKMISALRNIDLVKLGLEPGDELYYYVEAFDNRSPDPNRARTETYFVSILDTASMTTSVDPGLGVDLMPEYFRSQRQIIIDSEKLLKEKSRISREQFNSRSNELAHDEKVLRLRYGEFLGEEFESSIGPADAGAGSSAEDIVKAYGHEHDTDEEHAARADESGKPEQEHGHDHGGDDKEDPVKAYMHAHDSEEEATFFTQSIRAKLKAAITIMWDAELHLRMYTPERSLPYQYKALKLLKEISQDSRIYVHRTGFDPPPLKEEKRLTGDLTEAASASANSRTVVGEAYPAIRRVLAWLEKTGPQPLTSVARDELRQAGNELSSAALQHPGRYLEALSMIRSLSSNELPAGERQRAIALIREAFNTVLPVGAPGPSARNHSEHTLDDVFRKRFDALSKDEGR